MTLTDMFAPDEQGVENKIDVERAMGRLSYREAAVLYLWVTGYTQAIDAWNKGKVEAERQ